MARLVGRFSGLCRRVPLGRALAAALALVVSAPAPAAFQTQDINATLRIPPGPFIGVPRALTTGDFTVFIWVWPDGQSNLANVFEAPGVLKIQATPDGSVIGSVLGQFGAFSSIASVAPQALAPNEWNLIGVSLHGPQQLVAMWVQSDTRGRTAGIPTMGEPMRAPPLPPRTEGPLNNLPIEEQPNPPRSYIVGPLSGDLLIGRAPHGDEALLGVTGLIAIRNHRIDVADFDDVWSARGYLSPWSYRNLGHMNGQEGCVWMIGHSMTAGPFNALPEPVFVYLRAAVVGQPVLTTNVEVYSQALGGLFNVVREVTAAYGYTFASHDDAPRDGFFVRALPFPSYVLPPHTIVSGVSPRARRLATGPVGLVKVMTSANSRGVRGNDSSGWSPGNYAHGFMDLHPEWIAGVLNRRPDTFSNPWFGFDTSAGNAYQQGEMLHVYISDFARFWTGTDAGGSRGPGQGNLMKPGAEYTIRCRPQGLITADQPLTLQAHVLRFPGSSGLIWTPNKFTGQGQIGTDAGPTFHQPLDSEAWRHVFDPGAGDFVEAPNKFTIRGDRTGMLSIGDACYIDNSQYGSISLVTSMRYDAGADKTSITFEHPFGSPPFAGSTLRFGMWGFQTVEYTMPGLSPGDPEVWRGLRLQVDETSGAGVVLFGLSGWRPNVNGFVVGVAGWSGNGYTNQITRAFGGSIHGWMRTFNPGLWLQMFAQQQNPPEGMAHFTDQIRQALPDTEVVWLGDMTQGSGDYADWHSYILQQAAFRGVAAISLLMDPRLGSQEELYADGLRTDSDHINGRGNRRLAELWTRDLLTAAVALVTGDANDDGVVDFSDLNLVLGYFGQTGLGAPGDVDFDGDVDFTDLNIVLGAWGQPVAR